MSSDKQILLSICMPTYNRSKHIKRQLSFILRDASEFIGKEVEILVSDNASPDDTDKIIRGIYHENPDTFFYIEQEENIGCGQWVYLINKAEGKYVWLVGDDDVLRPGIVEHVIDLLNRYKDEDLGALFLTPAIAEYGNYDPEKYENNASPECWDTTANIHGASISGGLHSYDAVDAWRYEISANEICNVLCFITACVLSRNEVVAVYNTIIPVHGAIPYDCSMNAIRSHNCFFVDKEVCIYPGIHGGWMEVSRQIYTLEFIKGYLSLGLVGFSRQEIDSLMKKYFDKTTWPAAILDFIYKCYPPMKLKIKLELIKTVAKHGYLFVFMKGVLRGLCGTMLKEAKIKMVKGLASQSEHVDLRIRLRETLKLLTFGQNERNQTDLESIYGINEKSVIANFNNDKNKWGKTDKLGAITHPPEKIVEFISDADAVIVYSRYEYAISRQLDALGVSKYFWASRLVSMETMIALDEDYKQRGI
ncbi:hypothetical protein AGMMS50276_32130 [Synergistales bacterium]|nr:hypothetical protein AGMMS50276_32130 [Synergistales bacterium]